MPNDEFLVQFCSMVSQRKQAALYNNPQNRLTITSPYPSHTERELNMRRKAEILKYKSISQNTKSNGFSKAQLYTNLVNGYVNSNKVSQYTILNGANNTIAGGLTCDVLGGVSLSSSSDVPGPIVPLYLDPAVPLYNYQGISMRNYALLNMAPATPINLYTKNTDELQYVLSHSNMAGIQSSPNTVEVELGAILITDLITSPQSTFRFKTPVGIWCTGRTSRSTGINISVSSVTLNVYFNGSLVKNTTMPKSYTPVAYSNNFQPVQITGATNAFYAIQYCGNLNVSNLTLDTAANTLYQLTLSVTYSYTTTPVSETGLSNLAIGIFDTLGQPYVSVSKNCSANTQQSITYVSGDFTNINTLNL